MLVPVASVTMLPKMNLVGVTIVLLQIIVDMGVAAVAAAVGFVGAVADHGAIDPAGGGPLILLSTFARLCWMVGIGTTVIAFVFLYRMRSLCVVILVTASVLSGSVAMRSMTAWCLLYPVNPCCAMKTFAALGSSLQKEARN